MTVPFWCLLVTALLPYVLSISSGVARARQLERLDNKIPRQQQAQLRGWGARVVAAQQNAWEALPVFASAVFVAHLTGADAGTAAALSVVFVAARVAHAAFYLADLDILRSLAFVVGLGCCVGLFLAGG